MQCWSWDYTLSYTFGIIFYYEHLGHWFSESGLSGLCNRHHLGACYKSSFPVIMVGPLNQTFCGWGQHQFLAIPSGDCCGRSVSEPLHKISGSQLRLHIRRYFLKHYAQAASQIKNSDPPRMGSGHLCCVVLCFVFPFFFVQQFVFVKYP